MVVSTREPDGKVTLQTIADRLGVSRTTVSNAYGRPDQLNPALRDRIFAVAKELGYAGPSPAGRMLRRGRAGVVGVLLCDTLTTAFTDPAAILLLQGIAETTSVAGISLLLLPASAGGEVDPATVAEAVVDGFIVYSIKSAALTIDAILARGLPTVIVDEPRHPAVPFVGIDDHGAARAAAEHLLALGHRRFAVVADVPTPGAGRDAGAPARRPTPTDDVARNRLAGYAAALGDADLQWEAVASQVNTPEGGYAAAAVVLDRSPRPTAILAMTDMVALGVLWAARDRGVRVPEALSVVGFDDIPAAVAAAPPLTTVRQPLLEKGRVAGRLLLDPAAHRDDDAAILPTELVVRASTGPAPDGSR